MGQSHGTYTGDLLGGFRVGDVLGVGGMAVVYRAEQLSLRRQVALKVLSAQFGRDPAYRARFEREASRAASLEHPNIVPIHDHGTDEGCLYIAMRLVDGGTLAEGTAADGRPWDPLEVLRGIAAALDHAHSEGVVHRDVKPQNILLTSTGHPYLADFGIARGSADGAITLAGSFVGSLRYASPEQFERRPPSPSSDIYSLACVLYECLSGRVPHDDGSEAGLVRARLRGDYVSVASSPGGEKIDAVLERALATDPSARFPTATSLLAAATGALGDASGAINDGRRDPTEALPAASSRRTLRLPRVVPPPSAVSPPSTGTEILPAAAGDHTIADHKRRLPESLPPRQSRRWWRSSTRVLAAFSACAAVGAAAFAATELSRGSASVLTLNAQQLSEMSPAAVCPGGHCDEITRETVFPAAGGAGAGSTTVGSRAHLEEWRITLGKPSSSETSALDRRLGPPRVAIAVLRPTPGEGSSYKLLGLGPTEDLASYLGTTARFHIGAPLALERGDVVALSVLSWAPALIAGGSGTYRASRPSRGRISQECQAPTRPQVAPGSIAEYGCSYSGVLTYTAQVRAAS